MTHSLTGDDVDSVLDEYLHGLPPIQGPETSAAYRSGQRDTIADLRRRLHDALDD